MATTCVGCGRPLALRDDFRRRTLEEADAIFADLGPTGPFWTLPG